MYEIIYSFDRISPALNIEIRLVNQTLNHNKFYLGQVQQRELVCVWGKIGSVIIDRDPLGKIIGVRSKKTNRPTTSFKRFENFWEGYNHLKTKEQSNGYQVDPWDRLFYGLFSEEELTPLRGPFAQIKKIHFNKENSEYQGIDSQGKGILKLNIESAYVLHRSYSIPFSQS